MTSRGLILLGCGKMGTAMLSRWLKYGLSPSSIWVYDPKPTEWLHDQDVHLNSVLPDNPAIVVIAVKPQTITVALQSVNHFDNGTTLFISIAAGTSITELESSLGAHTPIIRAMPNTPCSVGYGITALYGNTNITKSNAKQATKLFDTVGHTVWLNEESEMSAVTGVSGSGPAYVFLLIEALASAGETQGLPSNLAMQLAKATVTGAGALVQQACESPAELRINVTSPNGTTQAALDILMDKNKGMFPLLNKAVEAATDRSRELSNE